MTTIKSVETAGWANLTDERLVFESGLNLILGPNEIGKSSIVAAIGAGLYEDGGTSSEVFRRRFRKWNDDGPFFVRLELEHEGDTYVLMRDFGEKTNSMTMPDGKALRDKRKIAGVVDELFGLPTLKSFAATACIRQEEVSAVHGEPTIREVLERQIAGAGTDTNALLKRLDRAAASILGKSGRTGELADLQVEANDLESQLYEKKTKLTELSAAKRDFASTEKELNDRLLELDTDQAAYDGFRRFREAEEENKRANLDFEAAQESVMIHKEAVKEATRCRSELKALNKKKASLVGEIEGAERFSEADTVVRRMEKDAQADKKKLEAVTKLDRRVDALDKKLTEAVLVPKKGLALAGNLANEVKGLRSALSSSAFGLDVQPEGSSPFSMTVDGSPAKGRRAKANIEAEVRFPGVGAVRVKNLTGEKEPLVDAIARSEKSLSALLARYDAADVGELEELYAQREGLLGERNRIEDRRDGILGDEDIDELRARLRDLGADLGKAERARDKTKSFALPSESLKTKKAELRSLESDQRELERTFAEANGVFNVLGKDEKAVQKVLAQAVKRLALADDAIRESALFSCSKSEYMQKERKLERLRVKVDELKTRKVALEARISADDSVGQDVVAAAEEQLQQKVAAIERFQREREILTTIAENVRRAREAAVTGLTGGMATRMAAVLSEITDSKYDKAAVDGNLEMGVYSPDKGGFIDLGNGDEAFSAGARDQVYLSARIALLEAVTGDSKTPLILDDTFANFDDMGRKERAFEMLEALAGHRQVIYLTCHECPGRFQPLAISGISGGARSRT